LKKIRAAQYGANIMDMMDYDYPEDDPLDRPEGDRPSGTRLGSSFGNLTSNPLLITIISFVIGTLFGLIALGWWAFPLQWTDASPAHLSNQHKLQYLTMVIDSYNLRNDLNLADERINALGEDAPVFLQAMANSETDVLSKATIEMFLERYSASGMVVVEGNVTDPVQTDNEDAEAKSSTGNFLLISCAMVLVLAAILVIVYFIKSRGRQSSGVTAAMRAQEFTRQAEQTDYGAMGEDQPIAQWMTTYLLGDDLFDDSFSIDSPSGEFLGECGLGIADTIGVGEPKRVSAFEVWLFDKNDIQTVTKVLMSGHTYNDDSSHNRLAAKGEPSLAVPNSEVILDTKTLRMVARVMDMDYGTGHLPESSFFQRITLELAIWPK
jgi:hypothetical protein